MQRIYRLGSAPGRDGADDDLDINMMPLIDMIFILLIFFLVTASFVRQTGVEINRPEAASATSRQVPGMIVAIDPEGTIYIDRSKVDLNSLRGRVERFVLENVNAGVIVEADRDCRTGRLIAVLDQCRLAGARNVAVATRSREK